MKNYVLRDECDVYQKSVIEIDDVKELVHIKVALEHYIEEVEGCVETANETIKRIESGNAYGFDGSMEEAKKRYDYHIKKLEILRRSLASLQVDSEINVKQLEIKYKKVLEV